MCLCCVEFVFSLDATDEFLKERVLNLPESAVQGTSLSFDEFLPRLATFRRNNPEDEGVLNFFEELEILPERIGGPRNRQQYGFSRIFPPVHS